MPLEGILNWWKNWNSKRVDDRMIEDAPPTPVVIVGAQGSGGELVFGANALEGPTMGGQAAINTTATSNAGYNLNASRTLEMSRPASFGPSTTGPGAAVATNGHHRLFQTTVTATAGGEIVAANVGPPTLAGYQACMMITHIYSDQTVAAATTTFTASAGGLANGLASVDITTVANAIAPDWSPGLAWQADTDAATIQVAAAAGQYGNAQAVTFCGEYWYET